MFTSQKAIDMLLKATNPNYIHTMFVAGSQQEELIPQTDLDVFTIVKKEHVNDILNTYQHMMQKLPETVTYSFVNGPDKKKDRGLVHLIVWTDDQNAMNASSIYTQPSPILSGIYEDYTTILGKDLEELFPRPEVTSDDLQKRIRTSQKRIKSVSQGTSNSGRWRKLENSWVYERVQEQLTDFDKEYLVEYYQKHMKNYEEQLPT